MGAKYKNLARKYSGHIKTARKVIKSVQGAYKTWKGGKRRRDSTSSSGSTVVNNDKRRRTGGSSRNTSNRSHESAIIKSPSEGISNSRTVLAYKMQKINKLWHKISEPTTITVNVSGDGESSLNNQVAVGVGTMVYGGPSSSGTSNGIQLNIKELYNQCMLNTGATANDTINSFNTIKKLLIDHIWCESLLTSSCSDLMFIDIYDCVSKITQPSLEAPALTWANAIASETANTSGFAVGNYNQNPTQFKKFNIKWKVIKKTRVELGEGRTHKHVFQFKPNRFIDTAYGEEFQQIRGITVSQLLVIRGGQAVRDVGSGAVGIGSVRLMYEATAKYTVRPTLYTPKKTLFFNNLPTFTGSQRQTQEYTGQPINVVFN